MNFSLSFVLDVLGKGTPARFDKATIVGSSTSPGVGSLLRSHSKDSDNAFFLDSFGIMPGGREWPAKFATASTVRSSRFLSRPGLFLRNQFSAFFIKSSLFFSVRFFGIGRPVSLEMASIVGSSRSSRIGSLLRSQLIASSRAFLLGSEETIPGGSA